MNTKFQFFEIVWWGSLPTVGGSCEEVWNDASKKSLFPTLSSGPTSSLHPDILLCMAYPFGILGPLLAFRCLGPLFRNLVVLCSYDSRARIIHLWQVYAHAASRGVIWLGLRKVPPSCVVPATGGNLARTWCLYGGRHLK